MEGEGEWQWTPSSQDGDLVRPFVGIQCPNASKTSGWSTEEAGSDPPFPGWLPGDEAILKFDTTGPPRHGVRGQLRLYHLRLSRSFAKDLPDISYYGKSWQICISSMKAGYSAEILTPTPAEKAYLA